MNKLKRIILCGLLCTLFIGCFTAVASAAVNIPSLKNPAEPTPFVKDYYVEPIHQEAPFLEKVLPEIRKNIKENNKSPINPYFDKFVQENNPENLQSLGSTTYANINGKKVTADPYFRISKETTCNPNLGLGLMIYQCLEYKKAHPEEDVSITFSSYRTSATTAVCVIPESKYYGYMRSLFGTNYDEHGFVRISYLLTEAARMGIDVTLVNQLPSYGRNQWDPATQKMKYRSHLNYETYFKQAAKSDCYNKYEPGKKVSDFLNCVTVGWNVTDKTADMQHVKSATVSHYLATDGTVHRNAVFFSTSNLDEIEGNGRNGNNGSQTSVVVSDHDDLYRVTRNYTNLMIKYQDKEGLFELRKLVKKLNEEQIALIKAGKENQIPKDEQIVYLGTKQDKVFQLYFTPFGGANDAWNPEYNPICNYADKLATSEGYVEYIWNEWNAGNCNLKTVLTEKVEQAFCDNPNPQNKIVIRTDDFNVEKINQLNLGSEIGYRDIILTPNGIHAKDFQMSYVEKGVRHRVSILSSCNFYPIAFHARTNSMLVIDETDKSGGDFYYKLGAKFSHGMFNNNLMVNPANLTLSQGETYKTEVKYSGKKTLKWTSSNTSVATVSNGKIKAVKPGSATITVTDGTYKDTVNLKVMECVKCYDKEGGQKFSFDDQLQLSKKYSKMPVTFESTFTVSKGSLTGNTTLLGSDDGFDRTMVFGLNKSGQPRVEIRDRAKYISGNSLKDPHAVYVFDKVNVATGKKVHMSIVMDSANKKIHCYVNGKLAQTKDMAAIKTFTDKYIPVIGGDHRNGNPTYFTGQIHSIALWSDVRSANEISADYTKGFDKLDKNIIAAYDLNKCEDCMTKDLSGNGNNLKNVPMWLQKNEVASVGKYDFSFAVVGDTQTMCEKDPEAMESLYDWIVANKNSQKIKYVLGLGDITENRGDKVDNSAKEWNVASKAISKMNGEIPYALTRGNHDNFNHFNEYLTNGFYEKTIDGQLKAGDLTNAYRCINIQGKKYLIMNVDFAPTDRILNWANDVIKKHSDHKVIVITHAYMYRDGTTMDDNDLYPATWPGYKRPDPENGTDKNNGDDMWTKCFSKHKNVLMVLSGHDPWQNIVYRQDKGDKGNLVTQMLVDPQYVDLNNGSVGMVAMMYFSNDANTITMRYYSVEKDCYGSPMSQFTIDLNEHKHTYETSYTQATPDANGKAVTTCTTCDEVNKTETIYAPKTMTLSKTSYAYDGTVKTPSVTVKDAKGNTLVRDKDYFVSYGSGRKAIGKYTVKVIFKGQYTGEKSLSFNVVPAAPTKLSAKPKAVTAKLSWKAASGASGYEVYMYDTKTKEYKSIGTTTKNSFEVTKLKQETSYKFKLRAFSNNGGKLWSDYSSVITVKTKKPVAPKSYKLSKSTLTYNGKKQIPSLIIKDKDGYTLVKGKDYTVTAEKGRKLPGKYTVKVTCKGDYKGTKKLSFKIRPAAPKKITSTETTSRITLSWSKATGADGYRIYKYNTKTKKYVLIDSVTVGRKYKVKNLKPGTTYKFKIRAYERDGSVILGKLSGVYETATETKAPALKSIKSKSKGKVSFTWSNVNYESGYQLYYSTKKIGGYKKLATYKKNVTKATTNKLKSGKKYYFKVRTYKKTASGNVYSKWSSAKSIKVK